MTRIGEVMDLNVARSQLMRDADGRIRFLSRYFLRGSESLVHGAEIIAGYLEDEKFVQGVAVEHRERDLFTYQVLCAAIEKIFPSEAAEIHMSLVRMIAFDAQVGNHDRHLYNWGVIVDPRGRRPNRFSPIYDTARGLFWNDGEEALPRYGTDDALRRYVMGSEPQIGWDGGSSSKDHFSLVGRIAKASKGAMQILCDTRLGPKLPTVEDVLKKEFSQLLSPQRQRLIMRCLALRSELYDAELGSR